MREEVPPVLQYQILQLALDLPASKFSWFRIQVKTLHCFISFFDIFLQRFLFQRFRFVVNIVLSCVVNCFVSLGGCRCRIIVWREVGTLPASQDVCQQQQQPPEDIHTDAGS